MQNSEYAIVIGGTHFNPLGLVRSLGEMGIKTVFINTTKGGFSEKSKYATETVHANGANGVVDAICDIVKRKGGKPVIFPSCDFSAEAVDKGYDILEKIAFCPGCNGRLERYISKEIMCELAEKAGFIVPETKYLEINENFAAELKKFGTPFIIKPVNNFSGSKNDIMICTEDSEIKEVSKSFGSYKKVLVQRYVDGKNNLMVEYCGCKTRGEKVEVYGQLEKIREYPVNRGSTSYAVINKKITYIDVEALDRLLDFTEFSGIFDLEIKVVDDIPYFIEINFRNGAPAYAFTRGGFNIPYIWYKQQKKEKINTVEIRRTKLMCEGIDLSHVFDKNVKPTKWLKEFFKADAHMIFNKKDFKPVFSIFQLLKPFIDAKLHRW